MLAPALRVMWVAVKLKSRGTCVTTRTGACAGECAEPPLARPVMVIG